MSTGLTLRPTVGRPTLPSARGAWLLLLLGGELLALSARFYSRGVVSAHTWWGWVLCHSAVASRLAVVVAMTTFVVGGARLRREIGAAARAPRPLPPWPFVLGHLAAFAAFVALTAFVLEGGLRDSAIPGAWVLAWGALGVVTLALWAAAAVPAGVWLPLARRVAGPFAVAAAVALAAWPASYFTQQLWELLAPPTLWVVEALLRVAFRDVVCNPAGLTVGTERFVVYIAPGCSGYEGIGLIWVFLGAYLWVRRGDLRFPRALLILPAATLAIWLANAIRIALLVAIGDCGAPAVAKGGFHSHAGWLAFNAVALGAVAVLHRLAPRTARPEAGGGSPSAPYLVPLLALMGTMTLTAAVSAGFDWLYPLRVAAVAAALWHFRRGYAGLRWRWSWTAAGIGAAAFAVWLLLEPAADAAVTAAFGAELHAVPAASAGLWLLLRVVGSVVTVPLAEELAFRGYLTRRLAAADFEGVPAGTFRWFSFLVSSALFGLLHGRWVAGTAAGALYALALYRRRELADAVTAHATTNLLIAAYVLVTGTWSLWV
jgi:exosortase E/protease (VPEID-CTERM system)